MFFVISLLQIGEINNHLKNMISGLPRRIKGKYQKYWSWTYVDHMKKIKTHVFKRHSVDQINQL